VSQPNSAVATSAIDTSNFRKHTHGNPVQRMLIDRFHRSILAKIADLAPQTFLDAGCGEGFVAELLLKQMPGLELTGFDFNPDAVEIAKTKNPGATFITASIFDLPFDDNSFDVVGCFEVLEHLVNPEQALKELTRVASKAVIVSVPHEPFFCYSNVARGKNLDIRPRGSDPDHKNFWSRKAFGDFAGQELDVVTLTGSFPWTICIGKKRG
jgi:2-polyprenyl-3-methyl-5-hydroxy-6-metoxy-1,4-benzoquinol methylase